MPHRNYSTFGWERERKNVKQFFEFILTVMRCTNKPDKISKSSNILAPFCVCVCVLCSLHTSQFIIHPEFSVLSTSPVFLVLWMVGVRLLEKSKWERKVFSVRKINIRSQFFLYICYMAMPTTYDLWRFDFSCVMNSWERKKCGKTLCTAEDTFQRRRNVRMLSNGCRGFVHLPPTTYTY